MNRLTLLVITGIMASAGLSAQSGNLVGKIIDQSNKQLVSFGTIQLSKDGKPAGSATSDIDGKYKLEKIPCGIYTLKVNCIGYDTLRISDVTINANRKLTMNLEVSPKAGNITEVIPIPLFIPKKDTVKR